MNATPERAEHDRSKTPRLSRLEKLRADRNDDGYEPDMPPVAAGYLLGYLWEVGPVMAVGMGAGPVTQEELRAWQRNAGVKLQPWEARFLRRLSCDYLTESHRAEKSSCPAPWKPIKVDHASMVDQVRLAIRNMAGSSR